MGGLVQISELGGIHCDCISRLSEFLSAPNCRSYSVEVIKLTEIGQTRRMYLVTPFLTEEQPMRRSGPPRKHFSQYLVGITDGKVLLKHLEDICSFSLHWAL